MSGNTQPFRKVDKDSPDQFIRKMERTMSKKRKNNYKNIEELENIYDSDAKTNKNESFLNIDSSEIKNTFKDFGKGMQDIADSINKLSGSKSTKKEKKNETTNSENKSKKDVVEGFSNTDDYTKIYKPEYEYDTKRRPIGRKGYAKLTKDAKSGLLNTTKLKKMLNTGIISQSQYNNLFGLQLDFNGFQWKHINPEPTQNERCPKWNKNCGGDGTDIMEYLKKLIQSFKQIVGIYYSVLTWIAKRIYNSTDGKMDGRPSKNAGDVTIIANILNFFIITVFVAQRFAYNWFYITFYRDEGGEPVDIDFSHDVLRSLKGLLIRFFKCLVQPVILLDAFVRLVIPKGYLKVGEILKNITIGQINMSFIGKIMNNPIFIFLWLTIFILVMACTYSGTIIDMLYSYLADSKVPYEGYLHGIIAYDWIIGIAAIGVLGRVIGLLEVYLSPITSLFWFIILVIFSHLLVRFAGIFLIVYLYVMSFFAMNIYSRGGYDSAMKGINIAFKSSIHDTDNKCPKGFWEKIVLKILKLIYDNLSILLFLIVLIYSIVYLFMNMVSESSKIILGSLLSIITTGVILGITLMSYNSGPGIEKNDIDIPK
uniref:Uncharacterized protein n=1 Tax=viral metagenome TaxID=1070528 RepID=A0A6C0HH07_9ZZZZ